MADRLDTTYLEEQERPDLPSILYGQIDSPESHWKDKLLVVGIDVGTTHSGYVWSFLSDYKTDKTKIHTKTWKGEGRLVTGKTPTCLLLKPDKSFFKFGYDAMKEYSKLVDDGQHKEYHYFEKFKMTLYAEKTLTLNSTVIDSEGRAFLAVDIFTETIKYLKENCLLVIQAKKRKIPASDIYYVITTPAIWSEKAKDFMRKAGEKAGIAPDHLRIALEPECAAVYVQMLLKSPQYPEEQRPDVSVHITRSSALGSEQVEFSNGKTYLVIDMGGGTIDMTLHKINEEGLLQELETPSGGSWGSDRINEKFKNSFIIGLVGAHVFEKFRQLDRENYIEWLSDIEHKKCSWDGDSNVNIAVPPRLLEMHRQESNEDLSESLKQSPHSSGAAVSYGKLKIKKDTFETFFSDTIQLTITHTRTVLAKLDRRVDMILMIGGFADCELMRRKMEENLKDKVDAIIYPTAEAVLAVLKGSVLYGRDPSVIDTRICRYTYGLDSMAVFDPSKHPAEKKVCMKDRTYCKDVFLVLIKKGDSVTGTSCSETMDAYPRYAQQKIEFPFYRSETKLSPRFVDEEGCFHIGTLTVELPPEEGTLDSCIKLKVMFGLTELTAEAIDSTGRKFSSKFSMWQN